MSPIGIGAALLAIYLGLISRPRFWWKGLALLSVLSLLFAIISIAAMRASPDPLAQGVDYPFSAPLIGRGFAVMLGYMLMFYGFAAGARWVVKRISSRPD